MSETVEQAFSRVMVNDLSLDAHRLCADHPERLRQVMDFAKAAFLAGARYGYEDARRMIDAKMPIWTGFQNWQSEE